MCTVPAVKVHLIVLDFNTWNVKLRTIMCQDSIIHLPLKTSQQRDSFGRMTWVTNLRKFSNWMHFSTDSTFCNLGSVILTTWYVQIDFPISARNWSKARTGSKTPDSESNTSTSYQKNILCRKLESKPIPCGLLLTVKPAAVPSNPDGKKTFLNFSHSVISSTSRSPKCFKYRP